MNFNEFKEVVIEKLKDFYGHDAEVTVKEVLKRNDICHTGVTVQVYENESVISPVVYIDNLYSKFKDGSMELDDVMDYIVKVVNKSEITSDTSEFRRLVEWEYVKDKIYPIVVQTEKNHRIMEDLISKEYMDLSVLYNIRLMQDESGIGCVKVTTDLFDSYGITVDELHQQALINLRRDGYVTKNMVQILNAMIADSKNKNLHDEEDVILGEVYVTTTEKSINGAAIILDIDYFQEKFGNLCAYILPSSAHELIVLPTSEQLDLEYINNMIQEVNSSCVDAEDVLSNHAYFYDGENKLIRCA